MNYDIKIMINNILKLMEQNHITQNDLARILHTHQSRISTCLRQEGCFSIPQIVALADYFNLSVDILLGIENQNKKKEKENLFETYTDVFRMFFYLTDNFDIRVKCGNFQIADNELEIYRTYAIYFNDTIIKQFLVEWNEILKICNREIITGAEAIYDTWKHGVLEKYNFKINKDFFTPDPSEYGLLEDIDDSEDEEIDSNDLFPFKQKKGQI